MDALNCKKNLRNPSKKIVIDSVSAAGKHRLHAGKALNRLLWFSSCWAVQLIQKVLSSQVADSWMKFSAKS